MHNTSHSPRNELGNESADRASHLIGRQRGTIADTLAGARASLKNPSRPFTPSDPLRRLGAHSLLPSAQNYSAPATPLLSGGFEPERPFTGRAATSGRSQRLLRKHVDGVLTEEAEFTTSGEGAQILVLNDEDTDSVCGASVYSNMGEDRHLIWPEVESLLNDLQPGSDGLTILKTSNRLLELLSITDAISQLGTSQRSDIVRSAARCLEISEPRQLAKLAGIILLVTKGGSNLLACAKILFKFSKSPSNDDLFVHEGLCQRIVGAVGESRLKRVISAFQKGRTSEAMIDAEAMVYLIGAMKNFSATSLPNQKILILEGAVKALAAWISPLCRATPSTELAEWISKGQDTICNLLIQVTGTLRNLAVGVGSGAGDWQAFSEADIPRALRAVLITWSERSDLVLNVTRVLSKMSLSPLCRSALLDDAAEARGQGAPSIHDELVRLLHGLQGPDDDRRRYRLPAAIRACFVLGNLCAEEEEQRRWTAGLHENRSDEQLVGCLRHTWQLGLIAEVLHRFTGEIVALEPRSGGEAADGAGQDECGVAAQESGSGAAVGRNRSEVAKEAGKRWCGEDAGLSGAKAGACGVDERGGAVETWDGGRASWDGDGRRPCDGVDGKRAAASGVDLLVKVCLCVCSRLGWLAAPV